jgi:hypothetical protein
MKATRPTTLLASGALLASALLFLLVVGLATAAEANATHKPACCKGKVAGTETSHAMHAGKACPMKNSGDDKHLVHGPSALAADTVRAERVHSHELHEDVQRAAIEVTSSGYTPATIRLERGLPAELVFTRTTASGCTAEVHIPEVGVAKTALPQGEAVTVLFTPGTSGAFAFLCGMDMLRGTLIVA